MKLRSKLLLAQLPLASALAAVGTMAVMGASDLGEASHRILRENYRSIIAAQRMMESLERLDSAALFVVLGERPRAFALAAQHRRIFEDELRAEKDNITEVGEAEAVGVLQESWVSYNTMLDGFLARTDVALAPHYFRTMEPAFVRAKAATRTILDLNQDAMVRKDEAAQEAAATMRQRLSFIALGALAIGLWVSIVLTARLLRPLESLGSAVRRIADGDLDSRAAIVGHDEIAALATEFNDMAEHLAQYRRSSLGELLQAQEASRAAIDSLPDPVMVFDKAGQTVSLNDAAEALFGWRRGDTAADPLATGDPVLRGAVTRARNHVLTGRRAYVTTTFEEAVRVATPEGERSYLPRAAPMYSSDGALSGVTVLLQDVTRLRRFADLEDDLVATVAHELRTPLTSLRMAVHLCIEQTLGPLTERQADMLYAAREECERLQRIIDDLLDLARLKAGKLALAPVPVAADALLRDALERHALIASQRQVHIEIEAQASAPRVRADRERVSLAFANLVANAIRHTQGGGVVTLRWREQTRGVRFEVQDTGPGIPLEEHERIFTRFARLPSAPEGGIGLGLSIAREIIEAHGGQIGVESAVGQGSTFWFTLPVALEETTTPTAPEDTRAPSSSR